MSKYFRLSEVAAATGTCSTTIRRLIKRGELPAIKIGAHFRISEEALNQLLSRSLPAPEDNA
jgi:excisionase family DNA binding protein